VTNAGAVGGDERVEIYLVPKSVANNPVLPLRALVGFEKMHLRKDETRTIQATIDPRRLSLVAADGSRSVQPGEYDLYVGGSQPSDKAGIFLPFHIEGTSPVAP
jgi:beta-glucosidase